MKARRRQEPVAAAQYRDGFEHLADELRALDGLLRRHVARHRGQIRLAPGLDAASGIYITDEEVDALLDPDRRTVTRNGSSEQYRWSTADHEVAARVAASAGQGLLPLPRLVQLFSLTRFEARALVVCLAPELRRTYDPIYAYLQDDVTRKRPSVDLVLQLLCESEAERWYMRAEAFSDRSPLFRHRILRRIDDPHSPAGRSGLAQFLRVDARILEYLLGGETPDARLSDHAILFHPVARPEELVVDPALRAKVLNLRECFASSSRGTGSLVVFLEGPDEPGTRDVVLSACAEWGCPLLHIDMELLLAREADVATALRTAFRDALLWDSIVYVALGDTRGGRARGVQAWAKLLAQVAGEYPNLTFLAGTDAGAVEGLFDPASLCAVEVPQPDVSLRSTAWHHALRQLPFEGTETLASELAAQFRLTPAEIRAAAASVVQQRAMNGDEGTVTRAELYAASRRQSHHNLGTLAVKVDPRSTWDDLVIPPAQREQLEDLCRHVRHRHRVFHEWGFGRSGGHGISALFAGPSGTGKTMAAGVIAHELRLELYRIDLSAVVNKYIGETEKNLSAVFREAGSSNAILFFDEADALFGRRTKVSDAHDRYANIETSHLLQRMEAYDGVVILATNLRENIDEAFTRRIRFAVDFPFPDSVGRRAIWRAHVPPDVPLSDDVDYDWLARQLPVTGGAIRNIVVNAAVFAAGDGGAIGMDHFLRGARREFEKMGKLWTHEAAGLRHGES